VRHVTRDRALLLVPQALLFGGMVVMLIVHPHAFTSALHSTRALLVNAALLAGWLLVSLLVIPRLVHNRVAASAVLSVVAIAAIVALVVPTLRDEKVVEQFPEVAAVAEPTTPPTTPATTQPGAPVRISTGTLRGIGHDATGTASIYERADGSRVVALEAVDIEPGPDYRVLVVPGADQERPGDGLELDALRGNQGTQYYEVPSGTDAGTGWTVLVWCRAFGVPIANASQQAA
jgi:hypothetical protein